MTHLSPKKKLEQSNSHCFFWVEWFLLEELPQPLVGSSVVSRGSTADNLGRCAHSEQCWLFSWCRAAQLGKSSTLWSLEIPRNEHGASRTWALNYYINRTSVVQEFWHQKWRFVLSQKSWKIFPSQWPQLVQVATATGERRLLWLCQVGWDELQGASESAESFELWMFRELLNQTDFWVVMFFANFEQTFFEPIQQEKTKTDALDLTSQQTLTQQLDDTSKQPRYRRVFKLGKWWIGIQREMKLHQVREDRLEDTTCTTHILLSQKLSTSFGPHFFLAFSSLFRHFFARMEWANIAGRGPSALSKPSSGTQTFFRGKKGWQKCQKTYNFNLIKQFQL